MNEQMSAMLEILTKAIDEGREITIKADEIVIKGDEITMSAPEITIAS
jgi:hypothetical protein